MLLISFSCYAAHLPGHEAGAWDHVRRGERRFVAGNAGLESHRRGLMPQDAYVLGEEEQSIVADTIVSVCRYKGWQLVAVHVRSTHLHGVVGGRSARCLVRGNLIQLGP